MGEGEASDRDRIATATGSRPFLTPHRTVGECAAEVAVILHASPATRGIATDRARRSELAARAPPAITQQSMSRFAGPRLAVLVMVCASCGGESSSSGSDAGGNGSSNPFAFCYDSQIVDLSARGTRTGNAIEYRGSNAGAPTPPEILAKPFASPKAFHIVPHAYNDDEGRAAARVRVCRRRVSVGADQLRVVRGGVQPELPGLARRPRGRAERGGVQCRRHGLRAAGVGKSRRRRAGRRLPARRRGGRSGPAGRSMRSIAGR